MASPSIYVCRGNAEPTLLWVLEDPIVCCGAKQNFTGTLWRERYTYFSDEIAAYELGDFSLGRLAAKELPN